MIVQNKGRGVAGDAQVEILGGNVDEEDGGYIKMVEGAYRNWEGGKIEG